MVHTTWKCSLTIAGIVVNYADSCLQFFTGDGIFYTSLHFKSDGTATSLKWAPFDNPAPDSTGTLVSQQLVDLIAQMQDGSPNAKNHLSALWAMIEDAIQNMPFPPSQYSAYANAIVGKPLALVNVGWSLELAQAPLKAQQTLGPLPGDSSIRNNPTEEAAMAAHDFPVKIGDVSLFDPHTHLGSIQAQPILTFFYAVEPTIRRRRLLLEYGQRQDRQNRL